MKLSQYGYDFSADLLAKYPAENRDESRLMVVNRAKGTIEHRIFKEIIEYFDEKGPLHLQRHEGFPRPSVRQQGENGRRDRNLPAARTQPRVAPVGRTGGSGPQNPHRQQALLRRRRPAGSRGDRQYHFAGPHAPVPVRRAYEEFKETLFKLGETPLPKWVREKVEPEDAERYQTIFASKEGAVAAPTAGMHFSKHLFKRMEIKGIEKAFITLHVGLGNFRTVDVEDLSKHKMDSEQFFVDEPTAETVNKTKTRRT